MDKNEFTYNETYCVKGSPLYQLKVLEIENADLRRLIQAERDVNAHMQIVIDELRDVIKDVEFFREHDGIWVCPWCGMIGGINVGHHPDCQLEHVLGKSS